VVSVSRHMVAVIDGIAHDTHDPSRGGELRGPNGDQEFVVTVVGADRREKNFEVKKKHFERLQ
jgi:hypothetical protein